MSLGAEFDHAMSVCRAWVREALDAIHAGDEDRLSASVSAMSDTGAVQVLANRVTSSSEALQSFTDATLGPLRRFRMGADLAKALAFALAAGATFTLGGTVATCVAIGLLLLALYFAFRNQADILDRTFEAIERRFSILF